MNNTSSIGATSIHRKVLATVDTCFLLENFKIVEELLNEQTLRGDSSLKFVLPYSVLQELDNISKANDPLLALRASNATKILQKALFNTSLIICQTIMDTFSESPLIKTNDDNILACVIYFGTSNQADVVLITCDYNLALKAEAHNVPVLQERIFRDCSHLFSSIKKSAKRITDENLMDWEETLNTDGIGKGEPSMLPCTSLDPLLRIVENSPLEQNIRAILDRTIGPSWTFLLKSPSGKWTPEFMMAVIDQHWNAAFASVLPRNAKNLASIIHKSLSKGRDIEWSVQSVKTLSKNFRDLLLLFGIDISSQLNEVISLYI